jgi:hypothetical protein
VSGAKQNEAGGKRRRGQVRGQVELSRSKTRPDTSM